MGLKTANCPQCGEEIEYDDDNDVVLCDACGEIISLPESTESDDDTDDPEED